FLGGGSSITDASARFSREAQAVGQLSHPHIVTLYDAQQEGDLAYLVMEFVSGESLESLLRSGATFSLDRVCAIGIESCAALEHAHSRGVVHRDIKPANILAQENGQVKVTDFGVAYVTKSTLTKPGQSLGTPSYMSPEQIEGKSVDGRSDLFSLGAVLYELCCNEKAFPGENITTVIYRILHTEPVPLFQLNSLFPSMLDATIRKALAKDPAPRYARAREFAEALALTAAVIKEPAGQTDAVKGPPRVASPSSTEVRPRSRGILVGSIGLAAVLIGGLLWLSRSVGLPRIFSGERAEGPAPRQMEEKAAPPSGQTEAPHDMASAPTAPSSLQQNASPKAIRISFARDVKGILPVDEGDTFFRDDRKVVLWIRWANVPGKHTVLASWFNPEGELVYIPPAPEPFDSPAELWTTWSTLSLPRNAAKTPGQWHVEVQLDGQPLITAYFSLLDQRRPADTAGIPRNP
ncbi:MAG TPA: serine/threonine-protein kinase, partial [Candidatus Acidoferrum sp.]|nr:serine/threonine-protein kinase [Candidatus Acidoferrum sp.]